MLVVVVLGLAIYLLFFGRRGPPTDAAEVAPPASADVASPPSRDRSTSDASTAGEEPATEGPAGEAAAPNGTGAVVHTLPGGVVSFEVPEGFALSVAGEPLLVQHVVPPCDEGYDYCVYLLDDAYVGTNFESAGVSIVLRHDLEAQDACLRSQPDGRTGLEPTVKDGPGFATSTFAGLGQGAAGHISRGELRRLWVEDACYQFETRVAKTQFGNYPEGAILRFTEADEAAVAAQLRAFLGSVALEDGTHPWP